MLNTAFITNISGSL